MFGLGQRDRRVGLALGSGAARGWAHIGVVRAVREAGYEPGWVAGSSIGALVGAALALDRLDALETFARGLTNRGVLAYLDVAMPVRGLLEGERATALFAELLGGADLKDARIPVCIVATDLATGEEVRLSDGPAALAVRASTAVPGIFAPAVVGGRYLVDGGLVNPVPVDAVRALGARKVIAVDLNGGQVDCGWCQDAPAGADSPPEAAPGAVEAAQALALAARREVTPREVTGILERRYRALETRLKERALRWMVHAARPNIFDVLGNSINIVARIITRERLRREPPDLLVEPGVNDMNLWEFSDAGHAIEAGYRATREVLEKA
jgi:NTE family protein